MIFNLLTSKVRRLSHIRRYSSLPVIRPENVAEHSFYCAMLAFAIAEDFKVRGWDVNSDVAMRQALFHDLEESMTGDILRSFKYSTPELRECIEKAGMSRMDELAKDFGHASTPVYGSWVTAKDGREGDIVAFCDLLCVVAYVREERLSGNRHLDDVATEVHGYINKMFRADGMGAFSKYVEDLYPNDDPNDIFREAA